MDYILLSIRSERNMAYMADPPNHVGSTAVVILRYFRSALSLVWNIKDADFLLSARKWLCVNIPVSWSVEPIALLIYSNFRLSPTYISGVSQTGYDRWWAWKSVSYTHRKENLPDTLNQPTSCQIQPSWKERAVAQIRFICSAPGWHLVLHL